MFNNLGYLASPVQKRTQTLSNHSSHTRTTFKPNHDLQQIVVQLPVAQAEKPIFREPSKSKSLFG